MKDHPEQEAHSLSHAVSNELVHTTLDLTIDYADIVMDQFLGDGILKEIPLIKWIYSAGKIGSGVKERFFVKKLLVFLKQLHSGSIDAQKLNDFKYQFDTDQNYRNNVTEHIIVFTDTLLDVNKAKILANLFRAHIHGHYDWDHFVHLSVCLNTIHPKAWNFLKILSDSNFEISKTAQLRKIQRDGEQESLLYSCGVAYETSDWGSGFHVSQLGKDLYQYGC